MAAGFVPGSRLPSRNDIFKSHKVSFKLPGNTAVSLPLHRVQAVGGPHGKWSSCLPVMCSVSEVA